MEIAVNTRKSVNKNMLGNNLCRFDHAFNSYYFRHVQLLIKVPVKRTFLLHVKYFKTLYFMSFLVYTFEL